jgi:hypothetical protein
LFSRRISQAGLELVVIWKGWYCYCKPQQLGAEMVEQEAAQQHL